MPEPAVAAFKKVAEMDKANQPVLDKVADMEKKFEEVQRKMAAMEKINVA